MITDINSEDRLVRQEELKLRFPSDQRVIAYHVPRPELLGVAEASPEEYGRPPRVADRQTHEELPMLKRAHKDLGRLGVFWHTQGSGKSYSMAFFAEKVRRVVPGNFTFVIMTDRDDLDVQIWRTFLGCGVTDENTPHASSGRELRAILQGNHRYVFTLIHKFNQPVTEPYSERDNIVVISDEAHRTQSGLFARKMRLALPNASFIGFTGTPLFKHDQLTRKIFGSYISRYDFRRSEEDLSTVKLVYENRGEKLGIARLDLNDRIAEAIERSELDTDQVALLERLLGKDYNGMLKSLREALAQYALGDDDDDGGETNIVLPIEVLVTALLQALEATEAHLLQLGFDARRLAGAKGFDRIQGLRDAVDAVYTTDESKRRYEILARQVFIRFKALLMEPSVLAYAERHDNIEAIYKKLQDRRDTADVTELLKELHRIVNDAIRASEPGDDHAEGLKVDLSRIDFEKLRDEFAGKVQRKHAAIQDVRDVVEKKLAQMLARNPTRRPRHRQRYRHSFSTACTGHFRDLPSRMTRQMPPLHWCLSMCGSAVQVETICWRPRCLAQSFTYENICQTPSGKLAARQTTGFFRHCLKDPTCGIGTQRQVCLSLLPAQSVSLRRHPVFTQIPSVPACAEHRRPR